ncbi:GNAT family N-acetyltransferase [Cohnella hongkongensis]|uniref:GNAT family N-acetyltransferase n=1 Tax=Cohnella hongkongensis TaxID=178337 RepID=A0ABV9FIF9_9BACL
MQKPTTIRIMLMILYFQLVMFLIGVGSLLANLNQIGDIPEGNLSFMIVYILLTVLSMVGMIIMINKRKYLFAVLISIVLLMCSMITNQMQIMLTLVVIMLFLLKPTRDYFRGQYVAPPSPRARTAQAETAEGEEADKAALEEPDEAPAEPLVKLKKDPEVHIREATPDDADTVYTLMRMAFEEYRSAIPPSSALDETEESVLEALRSGTESAVILYEDDTATAMVRFKYDGDAIYFFRLSVVPHRRRRGYARQLVKWIETHGIAKGKKLSRCKVRQSVQNNLVLYQNMGYEVVDQELVVRPAGTVKAYTLEKKLWE